MLNASKLRENDLLVGSFGEVEETARYLDLGYFL